MKKKTALVLTLVLPLLLSSALACKGAADPTPSAAPKPATTSTPAASSCPVIKWNMQSQYAMASKNTIFFGVEWAAWVKEVTGGRLDVTVHPTGTFAKTADLMPAVGKGLIDCSVDYAGYYPDTVPISNIESGLPMAWDKFMLPYDAYYNRGFLQLVREAYAKYNVYPLAMANLGGNYNFGTTFPIKTLADIKGKKIRAVGVYGDLVKALGAVPTVVSDSERYMALKTGVIDGYVATTSSLQASKFAEVIKYYFTGFTISPVCSTNPQINMDKWKALPADIRAILERDTKYFNSMATLKYAQDSMNAEAWAIKTQGVKFVTMPADDEQTLRQAAVQIWDQIAKKDDYAAKGVALVKKQLTDFGLLK